VRATDQDRGHLEGQAAHDLQELLRQRIQRGAQAKADATAPTCPVCGQPLSPLSAGHARTFQSRYGDIPVQRTRGYCKRCRKWRVPADAALGLEDSAGYSPAVQDMAALLASKMPVADASAVLAHLTGVKLPRATLDREAKRQGHAVQPLAAVGRALFGQERDRLKAWLKPLVRQLKNESAITVIRQLEAALVELPSGATAAAVAREVEYFHEHQTRMDYRAARPAGEPMGSGPVEATCRQTQCRFKPPGQFWSQTGDEALLSLEMFWRNGPGHLLFPHTPFIPARN
jgi:hypothetical protein